MNKDPKKKKTSSDISNIPLNSNSKGNMRNVNRESIIKTPWLNMGTLPDGSAYFMNTTIPNDPNRYIFNNGKYELIKFGNGGQFKDFMGNYIKAGIDTPLSLLGFDNVIKDSAYQGKSAQGFNNYTNAVSKVGDIARPIAGGIAGGIIGGPMGASVGASIGQGLGQFGDMIPNEQTQEVYNPYRGYAHGGQVMAPNAELEKQENTLNPDGSTTQFNGPTHENGGIPTKLDPSTLVFSDRLKKDGKTFADLNKPNMTKKEDKLLEDSKSNKLQKVTAELMKAAKNKRSLALFQEQEETKAAKMAKYANRLGYKMPNGGQIPQYPWGGPYGPYNQNDLPIMMNPIAAMSANNATGIAAMKPNFTNNDPQQLDLSSNLATQGLGTPIQTAGKTGNFPVDWSATDTTPQVNIGTKGFNMGSLPWDQITQGAIQTGLGLAANAGNLQALKYSKDYDKQSFERVSPDLVDPTAALKYNDMQFRTAGENIKNASGGNASTYIQNRKDLAINQMMTNNRIRQDYNNMNVNISNNAKMFNANQQVNESNANLGNKARMQDMRAKAIGDIGHNIYSQGSNMIKDNRMADTQSKYLSIIAAKYPEILKDPELRKVFGLK